MPLLQGTFEVRKNKARLNAQVEAPASSAKAERRLMRRRSRTARLEGRHQRWTRPARGWTATDVRAALSERTMARTSSSVRGNDRDSAVIPAPRLIAAVLVIFARKLDDGRNGGCRTKRGCSHGPPPFSMLAGKHVGGSRRERMETRARNCIGTWRCRMAGPHPRRSLVT